MPLTFLALLVVCFSSSGILSTSPLRSSDHDAESLEQAVYKRINAYRVQNGLDELRWDDRLAAQARAHSVAMARGERAFGHSGFKERVESTGLRFTAAAENVGQNQGFDDPGGQAVQSWLHSRVHRTNIEGHFNLTGVGVARSRNGTFLFTQIFMLAPARE
jgi:uncharacterized protein YkwD